MKVISTKTENTYSFVRCGYCGAKSTMHDVIIVTICWNCKKEL